MNRQEQTEFNHLKKVNGDLRNKLSLLIGNLKSKEQEQFYFLLGELIDNEIEQESYCNL